MKNRIFILCMGILLIAMPLNAQKSTNKAKTITDTPSWTMVFIPDIQNYSKYTRNQPILDLMLAWVEDNIDSLNIKMVMTPGDLVEYNDRLLDTNDGNQTSAEQWAFVQRAFDRLSGKVPYILSTGNHDYTYSPQGSKLFSQYRNYITPDRNPLNRKMLCQTTLSADGHTSMENAAFRTKMPDGKSYLFLSLEYAPRDTVMHWANNLLKLPDYKDDRVVLLTHSYIKEKNNAYVESKYGMNPEPYMHGDVLKNNVFPLKDANSGEEIWEKLVKPNNIELVLCGHIFGRGYRVDKNNADKNVYQMMFDTQAIGGGHRKGNGGDGWIRLLEFMPDGRTVKVKTFSPLFYCSPTTRHLAWLTDNKNEFTFTFDE